MFQELLLKSITQEWSGYSSFNRSLPYLICKIIKMVHRTRQSILRPWPTTCRNLFVCWKGIIFVFQKNPEEDKGTFPYRVHRWERLERLWSRPVWLPQLWKITKIEVSCNLSYCTNLYRMNLLFWDTYFTKSSIYMKWFLFLSFPHQIDNRLCRKVLKNTKRKSWSNSNCHGNILDFSRSLILFS